MKSVVLCEKPSVARDIARNLGAKNNKNGCLEGDKYVVTWALGHLITLQTPDKYKEFNNVNLESLPMIPKFMKTEIIKKTFKQYKVVENALNRKDIKEIIIATDAGREGELVARYIIDKAKCNKPIKRLWISSVTDKAIKDGFRNLRDGKEYLGSTSPKTKKENKNVQDAHEGVRPTDINLTPQNVMQYLDKDQFKLYNLIWQRFLISQLASMKYEQFEYILEKNKIQYRGSINKIIFDGYYKVFKEDEDLPIGDFPEIKEGDKFTLDKLDIKEDYTKPPARLTESSLVKTLEAEGIGRPSTYASIIDTLKKREYVKLQNKSFVPTEIGYEVKTQLDKFFPNIMNIKFTAKLEDELDEVDSGDKNWIDLLKVFYTELQKYEEKCKSVVKEELEKLVVSDVLDKNEKPMIMKIGRFGRYLASQDTESKENISLKGIDISLEDIKKGKIFVKKQIEELSKKKEGQKTDIILDNGSRLLLKYGRFGAYLESYNYKEDNIRKTIPKEIKTKIDNNTIKKENDILCLKDMFDKIEKEEAEILKKAGKCEKCGRPFKIKNGRWGKFLACTGYPECKNIKKIEK